MGISRSISEKLYAWMFNGKDHPLVEFLKVIAVSAAATAVLVPTIKVPFIYIANKNEGQLREKFDRLDVKATTVLNSVLQCTEQGYGQQECEQSQAAALDIANSSFLASYNSKVACSTNYHSPMVAWQAVQNNLSDAVPLYSCGEKGAAVRADGRKFKLD